MEKNSFQRNFLCLFLYILCLHGMAIFFFARGFLLTRTELSAFSHCSDVEESPCIRPSEEPGSGNEQHDLNFEKRKEQKISVLNDSSSGLKKICWTKPAVERVVIIVLDALRFDFVAPSSFFKEVKPWMNKLKVLQMLASEEGSSARIFKAIADPPTTSLQRLKGLTTGGLPTFIDVGNSFGAPAITEDNLIYQLIKHGRRVIMMGDDTWLQVFPNHFHEAYPFPSFNVKDLHTVDNGVIEHMFPALYRNDWDVIIAHFLGVDHAGHIFGVDTPPMIEKLEQYNDILEEVVSILKNHSEPGGLHENTMLIVMGDHGQTLNGDHGGGTPEEVETSIFAMRMHSHVGSIPSKLDASDCKIAMDGRNDICIGSIPQLDFAVTMAALIGVPFPFGSVGRVNPELYALGAGPWPKPSGDPNGDSRACLNIQKWMEHYTDVMCINSWQVKRYIDSYSASSIIGFSPEDLVQLGDIYAQSQATFSSVRGQQSSSEDGVDSEKCEMKVSILQKQIDAYYKYLEATAELARSKWTQFGLKTMVLGLILLLLSVAVHLTALSIVGKIMVVCSKEQYKLLEHSKMLEACFPWKQLLFFGSSSTIFGILCFPFAFSFSEGVGFPQAVAALKQDGFLLVVGTFAVGSAIGYLLPLKVNSYGEGKQCCSIGEIKLGCFMIYRGNLLSCVAAIAIVIMRAGSFLSNSFILVEGGVANFLLASTGVLTLQSAIENESMVFKALLFLILNTLLGVIGVNGVSKETVIHPVQMTYSSTIFDSISMHFAMTILAAVLPLVVLIFLVTRWLRVKRFSWDRYCLYSFYAGGILSYILILVHWILEDITFMPSITLPNLLKDASRLLFPRLIYLLTAGLTVFLFYKSQSRVERVNSTFKDRTTVTAVAMLSVWSSTILLLLGKQGPLILLLAILQGWCILELQNIVKKEKEPDAPKNELWSDPLPVIQWSLLAVQLFFCTGHSCTFDGLRYAAAFIGFDNFNIIRQGVLLVIDTFGVSHILPIFGLPLLVSTKRSRVRSGECDLLQLVQVFLIYGLVSATMATLSTVCVTIQRRHLMVWGLFAPKYVFEVIGLLLTDSLIVVATLYYF